MSEVFGFDGAIAKMEKYITNAHGAIKVKNEVADDIRDTARSIASSSGLVRTGKGVSGIQSEHKEEYSDVGWAAKPNFHLYFHERGFHALDNRRRKQRLKRNGKKRQRGYRGVKATYIPPTPHMRPAFDQKKNDLAKKIQQALTK